LGENSPNGRVFTLGSFVKITEEAHIFYATFFQCKGYLHINVDKNGLGYILHDLSTNSSGHPA
jgi:hypothetical protein